MAGKKQVVTTVLEVKEGSKGISGMSRTMKTELTGIARATGAFNDAMKGTQKAVDLTLTSGKRFVGILEKITNKNENLRIVSGKVIQSFKNQKVAQDALTKAQVMALEANKKLTLAKQKDEAVATSKNKKIIAREREALTKAEALAHTYDAQRTASLKARYSKEEALAYAHQNKLVTRAKARYTKDEALAHAHNNKLNARKRAAYDKAEAQARAAHARISAATQKTSKSTQKFATITQSAVQNAILSWKSLERVLLVHVIRRAFHQLLATTRQAVEMLQRLHTSIVEIRTISQGMPAAMGLWEESLRNVSDAFGIDIIDEANARYQILSNQVADGVRQTEMFSVATAKFAKVTKSTAEEAVNVLTAAINAYGYSAEDVTKVSGILFKLVEFGRVRISEISESLGRAAVPAAQLGISLEELSASIANITIRGVKATEAMTLVRGIVMKLNKPTGDMEELMLKWGVSSGEAMIATYGWAKSLKMLYEETKGSSSEIANLFGRIRPAMGMSALLADLDGFQDVLDEFGESATLDYLAALDDQFKSTGERTKIAFNQLKNYVQIGLGEATSSAILSITDRFKTFEKQLDGTQKEIAGLVNIFQFAVKYGKAAIALLSVKMLMHSKVLHGLILTYQKYHMSLVTSRSLILANQKATVQHALGVSLLKGTLASMAATAAPMIGIMAAIWAVGQIQTWRAEIRQASNDLIEMGKSSFEATKKRRLASRMGSESASGPITDFNLEARASLKGLARRGTQEVIAMAEKLEEKLDNIEEKQKEIVKSFTKQVKSSANSISEVYKALQDEIKATAKLVEDSIEKQKRAAQDVKDIIFGYEQEARTPQEKLRALKGQASNELGTLKNSKDIDERRKAWDRYVQIIDKVRSAEIDLRESQIKSSTDNTNKTIRQQNIYNKQIFDQMNQRRRKMGMAPMPSSMYQKQDEVEDPGLSNKEIQKINKQISADLKAAASIYDTAEAGFQTQQDEIIQAAKDAIKDLKDFRDEMVELGIEIGGTAGKAIKDAFASIDLADTEKLVGDYIAQLKATGSIADAAFKEPLTKAASEFTSIELAVSNTTKQIEMWASSLELAAIAAKDITALMAKQKTASAEVQKDIESANAKQQDTATKFSEVAEKLDKIRPFGKSENASELERVARVLNDTGASAEAVAEALEDARSVVGTLISGLSESSDTLGYIVEQSGGMGILGAFMGVKGADKRVDAITGAINTIMEGIKVAKESIEEKAAAEERKTAIDEVVQSIDGMSSSAEAAGEALSNAAKKGLTDFQAFTDELLFADMLLQNISDWTGGAFKALGQTQTEAQGGAIHAAMGQFIPQGTDTVPAMLSPGEFVMNKASTAQFMNQLVPMNYSQNMVRFAEPNNSMQFGDINVTVQGGQNNQQTALEIGNALRKEIRRGRLSL